MINKVSKKNIGYEYIISYYYASHHPTKKEFGNKILKYNYDKIDIYLYNLIKNDILEELKEHHMYYHVIILNIIKVEG